MTTLAWTILWLPFVGAVVITLGFLSKPKLAGLLATGTMLLCFAMTCWIGWEYLNAHHAEAIQSSITWIQLPHFNTSIEKVFYI